MSPQREMCDVRTVSDDIITRDILRDVRQYRNQFSTSAHQRQPSSSSANNNNIWSGSERSVKGHAGRNHNEGSPSRIHYHTHTHTHHRDDRSLLHTRELANGVSLWCGNLFICSARIVIYLRTRAWRSYGTAGHAEPGFAWWWLWWPGRGVGSPIREPIRDARE